MTLQSLPPINMCNQKIFPEFLCIFVKSLTTTGTTEREIFSLIMRTPKFYNRKLQALQKPTEQISARGGACVRRAKIRNQLISRYLKENWRLIRHAELTDTLHPRDSRQCLCIKRPTCTGHASFSEKMQLHRSLIMHAQKEVWRQEAVKNRCLLRNVWQYGHALAAGNKCFRQEDTATPPTPHHSRGMSPQNKTAHPL